jgi:predicted MPP superfamily phosphohydrolase
MDWMKLAKKMNMVPLINENEILSHQGAKILVGGVTDLMGASFSKSHTTDPFLASKTGAKTDFKLLLAHRPNSCYQGSKAGFDLQLSGHTHGGQFIPWSFLLPLVYDYYRGLYRHNNMWLYVNSGTGYWGPPHRFGIPSEITVLTLTS